MVNRTTKLLLTISMVAVFASMVWVSVPTVSGAAEDAKAVFNQKCASCHGMDGAGTTPMGKKMNLRDLRSKEVQSQSDDKLFEITAKGKGKMPGYEKSLGADKCKALVGYMRQLAKK
ncbi:MAG: cytochrome c [Blastocatellales bacterium]